MITRDTDPPLRTGAKRLRFDRYVLDLDRGCLVLEGKEIALRPKTFAVLHYLVENAGRLVSKDELFSAVWPNLVITDDALVQSIGELRRALGGDGIRFIKTIPRRGYRFDAEVSVVSSGGQLTTDAPPVSTTGGDDTPPPEPAASRSPLAFFTAAPTGWRLGLSVSFAVVILLIAAALVSGVGSGWKFLNVLGYGDRSAGHPAGAKPAIAVLPFVNQSTEREYFADGLTQDIINALGRFSALTVISWNGVLPYKGRLASPDDVGRRLAVMYLVEGSARQVGERVRVNAQLVDTRQGRVLWSARFDEALEDVFALQDNIARQIVTALAVRVAQIEQSRAFTKPTESLEAYDYVLRARPALLRPTRANIAEARAWLRRAIELDPNYAAAYAALAETYHLGVSMGWAESPTVSLNRAEELAIKALSLDNSEVRARVILARTHIFYQRYREAEAEIARAIAINPNDAQSLAGRGNVLLWLGQTDAAIEALEQAQRIDPELNAVDRFALALGYYLKGRYDAAIEQTEFNLRGIPGASSSRVLLAAAYAQQNRAADSARLVSEIRRVDPTFSAREFGTKFLRADDLERLREGLRKAGLWQSYQ